MAVHQKVGVSMTSGASMAEGTARTLNRVCTATSKGGGVHRTTAKAAALLVASAMAVAVSVTMMSAAALRAGPVELARGGGSQASPSVEDQLQDAQQMFDAAQVSSLSLSLPSLSPLSPISSLSPLSLLSISLSLSPSPLSPSLSPSLSCLTL